MPPKEQYKVTIKVGDATLEVQGAESGVLKIVEAISGVLRGASATPAVPESSLLHTIPSPTRAPQLDLRSFFQSKQPSTDVEAAATIAYYFEYVAPERERRKSIDAAALQDAFRLAAWPLPKQTIYTLNNARKAGYLDSAGEGEFRLNAVGYNLVEHVLGRKDTTEKPKTRPKSGRKKRRKK
ncbi:MAG: hypothetical protein A2Z21_05010 [Candidatus Fraserbacteria bacterium RBG_16_55_9]|uniref:Uncharacterized protein n=1 Tax=Fraserbacteria sp. (strain RBG_16_55_9) TaxID=1817864 RepID=A0A1F5V2C2_FRAXR|nr:MAG: hypothetical protein A2Z21_05010 [Candidatus Fraserbacteria bacterium RBG_16_55_9]